ncbi:retrovirus-related pol polyprotein from transposon TNT 1-94 [Tanacetum coccineum]
MATVETPHTLEYRGGQLNAASVLEVENFTNWKKRFMCHIIGIEPQFENIIKNGSFIPMLAGQRKPEGQWTTDERKAANLDQRLKGLIMPILPCGKLEGGLNSLPLFNLRYKALMNELVNDGINLSKLDRFINGLPKKWLSFWQSLRNTNHVKDSELASLFGKLKYEENLIDNIYETEKNKSLVFATPLSTAFFSTSIVQDFQDSPNDEEDTKSSHEYLNDLEEEYQATALLAKSKRFFKKGTQMFSSAKATDQTECHKCGKKGHFSRDCWSKTSVPSYQSPFQSKSDTSKASTIKNKGLIAEAYEWDKEEVSSDDNEMVEVKVLMTLAEDNDAVSKEGQRNNLLSKHRVLVHELNACKEQLLVLKQAKLDFLIMQHINTEILKENKNLRIELKELTTITEIWLNSSNKVNQCISEQIPSQNKRVLGVDQLTEDASSSGQKDLVFVKSSADETKVSIPGVERPWLSKAEGFILPNHDTGRILPAESQRNTTDPLVAVTNSSATEYDLVDESSVCSTPLPPLKKLNGAIINEPSSAPVKGNKNSSALVVNLALAGKLKSVKIKDDPSLYIIMKELNNLKLQFSKNQSSYSKSNQPQQVPQNALQNQYKTQFKRSCDLCVLNSHLSENCYKVLFCKRCEKTDHKTCDHAEYISTLNMSQHLKSLAIASSRSKIPRPSKHFFPPCTHCGGIDHLSNECLYYPICGLCGSYDHDTNGHNRIISLEREINLRNPQHAFKRCEACGSSTHTTTNHYDIEWFKRGEALQAKKAEILKSTRAESSNANRSKTPTKSQLCDAKYIAQFDEKRRTIFNSNKEVIIISLRVRDVYVLDMTSSAQESWFFAKASKNLNWLWHKRLVHLNFKTKQTSSIKKCLHLLHMDLFGPVTPRSINHEKYTLVIVDEYSRSTIVKRHLKTPYEIFHKRIPNINFLHVFGCPVYIHNHKDHLGKFDEKADDGYLLGYSLVSKAFRVFITYESPEPVFLETEVSSDQNGQTDQNDHNDQIDQSVQNNEILNDDHSEHSNHTNDEQIIDNLPNTKNIQIFEHLSSPSVEDTSGQSIIPILTPPLPIPSMVTPAPQDRWS